MWMNDHREWRKEIREILNERDAESFEEPVNYDTNTNFNIPGIPGAYNLDHSRSRNQLLNEINRLEEILKRQTAGVAAS